VGIGHARSFCTTSRLNYPEAGTLCTTFTVKIWIYRPGGLRPVTFLCSCVAMLVKWMKFHLENVK